MIWSMMEMSIDCPECDAPVHVDGPYLKVHCSRCQSDIDFPANVWKDLLEDVPGEVAGMEPGTGTGSNIFGHFNMRMTYGNLVPYCMNCKRDFDMDKDYKGGDMVKCPDCGTEMPVFKAQDWFTKAAQGADLIVGAWPEDSDATENKSVSDPVAFSCPKCGGSLMIDGSERLVKCEYCSTGIYLPDDLWLTLHPAKKKSRWFIRFPRGS